MKMCPASDHCTKKNPTVQQVTTLLTTSENVQFPGHNHILTTSTDDPSLWLSPEHQRKSDIFRGG